MIILGIAGVLTVTGAGAAGAILAINGGTNTNTPQKVALSQEQPQEEPKANGWKEESGDWYFYKDNEKQKNWLQDKNSWYYLGSDGKMRTGWIKDNETWYYLNKDGVMATNTTVDNCYLNEKGVIENTPKNTNAASSNNDSSTSESDSNHPVYSLEDAKNIILKEDGAYIKKVNNELAKNHAYAQLDIYKQTTITDIVGSSWNIPNEKCYAILLMPYYNGESDADSGTYLVGKETGNVYMIPHQGCFSAYQIKNNQVVKRFRWLGPNEDSHHEWR